MTKKGWPISRRTMLRGTGAAVALPMLEAMLPTRLFAAEAAQAPVRMAVLFMPNGVHQDHWTPKAAGANYDLPKTLEPLGDLKNDVSVITNLGHVACRSGDGHYVKTAGLLTGTTITKTTGDDVNSNGISVDQLAALKIGDITPFPSLEFGLEPVPTAVDGNVGYTQIYGAHISWRSPTSPLAKEINPKYAFERIFRGRSKGSAAKDDRSLLDLVAGDAERLRKRIGQNDRRKMDEYLESLRSLEKRLDHAERPDTRLWKPNVDLSKRTAPDPKPDNHLERVRAMLDVMVLAFQTDSTRVSSFMFGNAVSNRDFSFLDGVKGGHHELSHHQKQEEKLAQYQKINAWHVAQFAYMIGKMKVIDEGNGRSLLDNSMVLFGSSIRDGNAHDPKNLPLLLAGKAGGKWKQGQHILTKKDTPLANLYVTMLDGMGIPTEKFADSTGPVHGFT